jgi:hypothetical protein
MLIEKGRIGGGEAAGGGGVVAGAEVVEVGFEIVVLAGEVEGRGLAGETDLLPKIRAEVYMIFAFCGEEEAWRRESIAKWR